MKGIENVLEAFATIYKANPKAKLWLVGGGDPQYVDFLKKKIAQLEEHYKLYNLMNSISFFGRVSEETKLSLMGRSHVLLHASVKEGWGLVVLEAASQGTPSVVYKVAGLVDSVKDGKTGIIVKANTPKELGREALSLVGNEKEYKRLQQGGLDWVKSLTWEKVTKQSLNLLLSSRT